MKKIILLSLTLFASTTHTKNTKPHFSEMTVKESAINNGVKSHIITPAFQNPIHPSDLSASASPQFDIKSSGRYYVTGDLTQEANGASDIVVRISASNVTLDMNSKSIVPHVSGSHSTGVGIALVKGNSNIQIMNGNIHSEDSSGSQKLNTGIDLSNSGSGTSYSVKLNNIFVTRCKLKGITGTAINDLSIENCSVNDCYNSGSANIVGLELTTINNLVIKNSESNNNDADSGTCSGIHLTDCIDGLVENVTASSNVASTTVNGFALDSSSTGCKNITIKNLNASGGNGGTITRGLYLNSGQNVKVEDSIFNSLVGGSGFTGAMDILSSNNCSFYRCNASNNSAGTDFRIVTIFSSNSCHLEDCVSNNNTVATNNSVSAFHVSGTNNTFVRCDAINNSNTNTGSSSSASIYGFNVASNQNTFIDCKAIGNSTSANAAVTAAGFYTSGGRSLNKFVNCKSNANNASHTSAAVVAAGFVFSGAETRSQIVGCEASNNLVGDGSTSGSSARAYGIYFADTTGADQCQLKNCRMNNNSVSSSGLAFGFYDNDTSSTSLLIGNISLGHGKCLGSTLDSSLQWNGDSEPASSQNFFFKHGGTGSDPRNAINEVPRENFVSLSTSVLKWMNISVYDA